VVLSATAILLVLGLSGMAVAGVLAHPPKPPEARYISDAALMSNVAGTTIGDPAGPDPAAPSASEVAVTGMSFIAADGSADLYALPDKTSEVVTEVSPKEKVGTTGTTHDGFTQVAYGNKVGWVESDTLSTGGPLSFTPCLAGSGVEKGLQPDTIRVHRVVCAAFPQITRYGGVGGGGEHATGEALDIMTKDVQVGTTIAIFMRAHAAEMGVSQVIWRQHIWTAQRAGDGWRSMNSRGSDTANHMDHVHVTTYGNRGTL